jgi:hypothetical protein
VAFGFEAQARSVDLERGAGWKAKQAPTVF